MSEERKINGINEFLQMSMTNNMPLSVNEKRQIFDLIIDLQKQSQQKENIIKEVREYIEMHAPSDIGICGNSIKRYYTLGEDSVDHILEILDKVEE